MSLILQNIIIFLPYAFRMRMFFSVAYVLYAYVIPGENVRSHFASSSLYEACVAFFVMKQQSTARAWVHAYHLDPPG